MELNFDARTVDPAQAFDPLPPGWYVCQIIGSEGKPTKDETGGYLELKLQVLEGEFKNRVLFDRLNLQNKNEQTVEIAKKALSAICHAVNVIQMSNTQQLHGRPLLVKVAVRPATGQYSASNDVKGYKALELGAGGSPAAGHGVGGNTAGVPDWAGGKKPDAPATDAAAPSETTTAAPAAAGGFNFGGLGKGASAPSAPATNETPNWAKPAGA